MARRRSTHFQWSLDKKDPAAAASALIALSLMRCVRSLSGVFSDRNFDEYGALLAPAIAVHARLAKTAIVLHNRAGATADAQDSQDTSAYAPDASFLLDRDTLSLLGGAFARSAPRFKKPIHQGRTLACWLRCEA